MKEKNRSPEQTIIARSFMQNHVNHFPYKKKKQKHCNGKG